MHWVLDKQFQSNKKVMSRLDSFSCCVINVRTPSDAGTNEHPLFDHFSLPWGRGFDEFLRTAFESDLDPEDEHGAEEGCTNLEAVRLHAGFEVRGDAALPSFSF